MSNASQRLVEALDAIGAGPGGLTVTDLARALDVSKATASRALASLSEAGLVTRTDGQRYVLDLHLWVWGIQAASRVRRIAEIARPTAIQAVATTGALIAISILHGKLNIFLEVMFPSNGTTVVVPGAKVIPAFACAPGKAMLAYAEPKLQQEVLAGQLERYTDFTITSPEALQEELAQVREVGYAINRREFFLDTVGIGVPIFNDQGEVVAAVSSSGPNTEWSIEDLERLVPALKTVRDAVSAALGYLPATNMMG